MSRLGKFSEKFEAIGVSRQYNAKNKREANRQFSNSCEHCCSKGILLECDRCAINYTHNLICTYFATR